MKWNKKRLITLARKVERDAALTVPEIRYLLSFENVRDKNKINHLLQKSAVPLSLMFGALIVIFSSQFENFVQIMPAWTNLQPELLRGIDYLWDILGEPVGSANILYHLPNIILYSFGIVGIKKVFDAIDKKSWLDRVIHAQELLNSRISQGSTNFALSKGHSLLFVGKGDFIGSQFIQYHNQDKAITISEIKPQTTDIWNYYSTETMYENLKKVLARSSGENAGEYIFFPVKDSQIFLPGPEDYDLSPHKLDILCQDIRTIEKENKWKMKRIILVGDRYHCSTVRSEDRKNMVKNTTDTISLESISQKYNKVTLLDPTDIVLRRIIEIAAGRRIVFRATIEGIAEYKKRFYTRIDELGYRADARKKGILTIGYDILEDQTEQQMLSRKIDDYFPIVLSKPIHDALIRNGYKKSEFLYVPDLVLSTLSKTANQQ